MIVVNNPNAKKVVRRCPYCSHVYEEYDVTELFRHALTEFGASGFTTCPECNKKRDIMYWEIDYAGSSDNEVMEHNVSTNPESGYALLRCEITPDDAERKKILRALAKQYRKRNERSGTNFSMHGFFEAMGVTNVSEFNGAYIEGFYQIGTSIIMFVVCKEEYSHHITELIESVLSNCIM